MNGFWTKTLRFGVQTAALLMAIVFSFSPFTASVSHGHSAGHRHHVQAAGDASAVAAQPTAVQAGSAMPCCPSGTGQTDNAGCSAASCASLSGALNEATVTAVAEHALRDSFSILQDILLPHYLLPEHGPPRA